MNYQDDIIGSVSIGGSYILIVVARIMMMHLLQPTQKKKRTTGIAAECSR
jgi:hypothetical protein